MYQTVDWKLWSTHLISKIWLNICYQEAAFKNHDDAIPSVKNQTSSYPQAGEGYFAVGYTGCMQDTVDKKNCHKNVDEKMT